MIATAQEGISEPVYYYTFDGNLNDIVLSTEKAKIVCGGLIESLQNLCRSAERDNDKSLSSWSQELENRAWIISDYLIRIEHEAKEIKDIFGE